MSATLTNWLSAAAILMFGLVGLVIPFGLAVLWSLVDPGNPWSYPDILPPVLSWTRWTTVWRTTSLPTALCNSYLLAPGVACVTILLALPTAYAFARLDFPGKATAQALTMIPLVLPGFVQAVFFSSLLLKLGLSSHALGILIGHVALFLPYAIRILTVSLALVRQDLIDAARDLGAGRLTVFRTAYLPVLRPGLAASFIMVFILSIEEFPVSFSVGSPDFVTIPTILYSYLGYNFIRPNAAVISLILVVPNVLLMLLAERFLASRDGAVIVGKG